MNLEILKKRIKMMSVAMAGTFLLIHVLMLTAFALTGVMPMAYINIASIVFYVAMLFLIYFGHLTIFALATFIEINVHMFLAIIFTGWGAGFQITIIGIVILLFFAEYVARSLKLRYVPSIFLAPISAVNYIVSYIITLLRPSPYTLPESVNIAMQIGWGAIVFSIAIAVLLVFVLTTTQSQNQLTDEVVHDKLTGLPNRYYFASIFQRIESGTSNGHHWIAVADIDDFKKVNDEHGHICGDYVLKTIAELLKTLSSDVTFCRYGGEEFLLLGEAESASPGEILEMFRKRVEGYPFEYNGTKLNLTITVGYSYKKEGQTIDEWIDEADKRLYDGKRNGKNKVVGE